MHPKVPKLERMFSASQVKGIRTSLKLSRREFAERMGTSIRVVQSWELGERVPLRSAMQRMEDLRP